MRHLQSKFFVLLCGVAMVMAFATGCAGDAANKALQAGVEEANAVCPKDFGNGLVLEKVELVEKAVVYTIALSEDAIGIEVLAQHADEIKEGSEEDLTSGDMEKMFNLCADNGYGMNFIYRSVASDENLEVAWTADELKALKK